MDDLVPALAGVVEVECDVLIAEDNMFQLDLNLIAMKSLRSLKDSVHAVRFAGHRPNSSEAIKESGIAAPSPLPSVRKPVVCQNIVGHLRREWSTSP